MPPYFPSGLRGLKLNHCERRLAQAARSRCRGRDVLYHGTRYGREILALDKIHLSNSGGVYRELREEIGVNPTSFRVLGQRPLSTHREIRRAPPLRRSVHSLDRQPRGVSYSLPITSRNRCRRLIRSSMSVSIAGAYCADNGPIKMAAGVQNGTRHWRTRLV